MRRRGADLAEGIKQAARVYGLEGVLYNLDGILHEDMILEIFAESLHDKTSLATTSF